MNLRRIVAATDFSDVSLAAIETAFSLASETGATLYLLYVMELPLAIDPVVGIVGPPVQEQYEAEMERLSELVPVNMKEKVEFVVLEGVPARKIAEFAASCGADLIVVGTHGRKGLSRMLLGSTAESLLREAPCQVLIAKQRVAREA